MLFRNRIRTNTPGGPAPMTARKWARRAGVLGVSAALLGSASAGPAVAATATASDAAASVKAAPAGTPVNLHQLEVKKTEEGADDIEIRVDGLARWTAPNDAAVEGAVLNVDIPANVGQRVTLVDLDSGFWPDEHDILGEAVITGDGPLSFTNFGTDYKLTL